MVVLGVLSWQTLSLGETARLVPQYVVLPGLVLACVAAGRELAPRALRLLKPFEVDSILQASGSPPPPDPAETADAGHPRRGSTLRAIGWVLLLPGLIALLGFLVAVPLYTLLFFRIRSGESWAWSLGSSAAMWALLYGIMIRLLEVSFHPGWIQG